MARNGHRETIEYLAGWIERVLANGLTIRNVQIVEHLASAIKSLEEVEFMWEKWALPPLQTIKNPPHPPNLCTVCGGVEAFFDVNKAPPEYPMKLACVEGHAWEKGSDDGTPVDR